MTLNMEMEPDTRHENQFERAIKDTILAYHVDVMDIIEKLLEIEDYFKGRAGPEANPFFLFDPVAELARSMDLPLKHDDLRIRIEERNAALARKSCKGMQPPPPVNEELLRAAKLVLPHVKAEADAEVLREAIIQAECPRPEDRVARILARLEDESDLICGLLPRGDVAAIRALREQAAGGAA